jgi:hypothetical protein
MLSCVPGFRGSITYPQRVLGRLFPTSSDGKHYEFTGASKANPSLDVTNGKGSEIPPCSLLSCLLIYLIESAR